MAIERRWIPIWLIAWLLAVAVPSNARGSDVVAASLPIAAHVGATRCPHPDIIEHPEKIGIGTSQRLSEEAMLAEVKKVHANWFYTWTPDTGSRAGNFTAMVWGADDMAKLGSITGDTLLGFNEPDHPRQAKLSPAQALTHWPRLMATGKRLGSPATAGNAVDEGRWLPAFMAGANARWFRVDFIAVHHYSSNADVGELKRYLADVYAAYQKPIWVTEWALAVWSTPSRFTPEQQRDYFVAGALMMDDLPYVERHAWFGMFEGMDGWRLSSGLLKTDGSLSPVGVAFRALASTEVLTPLVLNDGPCRK